MTAPLTLETAEQRVLEFIREDYETLGRLGPDEPTARAVDFAEALATLAQAAAADAIRAYRKRCAPSECRCLDTGAYNEDPPPCPVPGHGSAPEPSDAVGWHAIALRANSRANEHSRRLSEVRDALSSIPGSGVTEDDRTLAEAIDAICERLTEPTPSSAPAFTCEGLKCPECGAESLFGYMLRGDDGQHMHTRYVCTRWESGTESRCGWSGWAVPGWRGQPASPPREPTPSSGPRDRSGLRNVVVQVIRDLHAIAPGKASLQSALDEDASGPRVDWRAEFNRERERFNVLGKAVLGPSAWDALDDYATPNEVLAACLDVAGTRVDVENPGDGIGAALARTCATIDLCAARSKTLNDPTEHGWDIWETRARLGREDLVLFADAFEELRGLRRGPRVDVEALAARIAAELLGLAYLDDDDSVNGVTNIIIARLREALGDTPAPSTSRVSADARVPEPRRDPPTHAPAPSSGALQIDCIATTPRAAARDAWVQHDRLEAEGWRATVGPVQDENEPHGPRVRVTATRQPELSGSRGVSRNPGPSGGAPTGPGWWWVLSADSRANERSFIPVFVSRKYPNHGPLGFVEESRGGWVTCTSYEWVGPCIQGSADKHWAAQVTELAEELAAECDAKDALTRAVEAILGDEDAAADPAKTCGPRRIEAATRARRLRAALDAAKGQAPTGESP